MIRTFGWQFLFFHFQLPRNVGVLRLEVLDQRFLIVFRVTDAQRADEEFAEALEAFVVVGPVL